MLEDLDVHTKFLPQLFLQNDRTDFVILIRSPESPFLSPNVI